MIHRSGYRPVVVGIDASAAALDALDWAAAEAAARGLPLRVVHACPPPASGDPYGVLVASADDRAYRQAAAEVLDAAVARARSVAPEGRVGSRLVIGPPGQAILEHARDAELVVVGNGRTGRLRRLLARSVGGHVIAHAGCAVAVVPAFHQVPPGPCAARVVVGIGDRPSDDATGFAFQAAEQRGIALAAVHAWTPHGPAEPGGASDDIAAGEEVARRLLDEALEHWTEKFPGVPVEPRLVRGHPAHALVAESAGAALTVVGTRGRESGHGARLGPVNRLLLRRTHTPVAVLRTQP